MNGTGRNETKRNEETSGRSASFSELARRGSALLSRLAVEASRVAVALRSAVGALAFNWSFPGALRGQFGRGSLNREPRAESRERPSAVDVA